MDYSDTAVIIPVKDEPAAGKVAKEVLAKMPNCQLIVIYKGDRNLMGLDFTEKNLKVIEQTAHGGKGAACYQAMKLVRADIVSFIDGDATYSVENLRSVVDQVRNGADLAVGNRFHRLNRSAMPLFVEIGNKIITHVANLLYGMRLSDSQTGVRALRKSTFDSLGLEEKNFGIESEINIKCAKLRLNIVEIPAKYYKRVGVSKQMKLIDGVKLLLLDFKWLI